MTRERLSRVLARPWLTPWIARGLRARLVDQSLRFFIRDTRGHGTYAYTIRGSGVRVVAEHGTPDVLTLDQVWYGRVFEPPAEVAGLLAELERHEPVVLDLGANVGMFGAWVRERFRSARITAYEPDERNAALHRRLIELNGGDGDWTLIEAAAGTHDGSVAFAAGDFTTSHVATAGTAGTREVPVHDVLDAIRDADLAKIDIEGAEWEILADPRFRIRPGALLILEYHRRNAPAGDPEQAAREALARVGMEVVRTFVEPGEGGTLWAWHPSPQPSTG